MTADAAGQEPEPADKTRDPGGRTRASQPESESLHVDGKTIPRRSSRHDRHAEHGPRDTETGRLLYDVAKAYKQWVVFSWAGQETAVALWTLHTYVFDLFGVTPILAVFAPTPEAGKTQLFDVAEKLVKRGKLVVEPTDAVLGYFGDELPTLLIDEIDGLFQKGGQPRGKLISELNKGFERSGTGRIVTAPGGQGVTELPLFYPKALGGINTVLVPAATMTRTILIQLQRKRPDQHVDEWEEDIWRPVLIPLQERAVEWEKPARKGLTGAKPQIPEGLHGRNKDKWKAMLAIAELAGPWWAARGQSVARRLRLVREETEGELLIRHIHEAFDEQMGRDGDDHDRIHTLSLLRVLCDRDDGPWAERWTRYLKGDGGDWVIAANQLNAVLKRFPDGRGGRIHSGTVRAPTGKGQPGKGFYRWQFEDAWGRYL